MTSRDEEKIYSILNDTAEIVLTQSFVLGASANIKKTKTHGMNKLLFYVYRFKKKYFF